MKKAVTYLIIILQSFCYSQQSDSCVLQWSEKQNNYFGDNSYYVPSFQTENFNFDFESKKVFYLKKIISSNKVDENSLIISNIDYEIIDESMLGSIPKEKLPTSIGGVIKNTFSRYMILLELQVNPIINDQNTIKRLKSFSYSFSYENQNKVNQIQNLPSQIYNSVLSSGTWFRFYVVKSGVYIINKSFLEGLGINTSFINPKKLKIYGSGGKMAPLNNNIPYPIDLEENAIQVIGEEDGLFNPNDYILFYAEGLDNWSEENQTNLNLYSDKAFYYLTIDGQDGKRMSPLIEPSGEATLNLTKYDDYHFHELDLTNIGRLGRVWFGDDFSTDNSKDFLFNIPNISTTDLMEVKIHFGAKSFANTNFSVKLNSQSIGSGSVNLQAIDDGIEATHQTFIANVLGSANMSFNLEYNNNGVPTSKGYLDFINIKNKSNLTGFGKQYRFQYSMAENTTGVVSYQFSNANAIKEVWDITDIYNVKYVRNNNLNNFSFKDNLGTPKKYVTYDSNDLYQPIKDVQSLVLNQNLKGTIFKNNQGNFQDIDYLIISPFSLGNQAEKLAKFHRTNSQLNVKVVFLENIYQEFSSGKQDIAAIRNFVKYVYDNASSLGSRIKYLNLFGDASFDFKDRITNNTNVVPIYHAINSYTKGESSFASDDFFTYMNDNEGNSGNPDIAVGRMPVSSSIQAEQMVNKIIQYYDIKSYGNWRNNYVSISDDSDKSSDATLQQNQNNLTDQIYNQKPFINFKKILLDSYQQEASAGGNRYPKAREEIRNQFERGALVFNYLGHGGEDGLTSERVWDKMDGYNFDNSYRFPLFITLTCDFSRFDNPYRPTAGEYTYWNPKGGAIGMVTTIRTIGQSGAESFNNLFASKLFSFGSNNYPTIGEALRQTKSLSSNSSANRVIFYLGDPALKLAIPSPQIVLTKVNDVAINQPIDDFKALSYIKLSGEIRDEIGVLLSDYKGELAVNIFDKNYLRNTFNNDFNSPAISFNNLGETIFRGNASITNGKFEFGFIVPKDIKIPLDNGRISFYSKRNEIKLDKNGYNLDIKIGGINTNAVADNTPPKIRLYMNDESFVNGGITNQSPFFLAFLEDEHGINTASGIGHDIVAILDGDETNPYVLNDYYETELDDFTKGKIRFPFRNLSLGLHTITFKAWDVYNNFISAEIQFIVVGDQAITLTNVLNYPNPFVDYTQFWFTHNRPFENLNVMVQIMTITGKVVKTINQDTNTEGFLSREITWDGKDDFGDKIGKGVYIYKLTVKSTLTGEQSEKIEKLVIL